MSGYSNHSSYPHHPPPPIHPQAAQQNDPLSHHGLPIPQTYQYDAQPPPQQQQPIYNNGHANGHVAQVQQRTTPPASSGAEAPKGNRLRKACDSCSVRKVKVCSFFISIERLRGCAVIFTNASMFSRMLNLLWEWMLILATLVRRYWTSMQSLRISRNPMYLQQAESPTRTS